MRFELKNGETGAHISYVGKTERAGMLDRGEAVIHCTLCDRQWTKDDDVSLKCLENLRVRVDAQGKPIPHELELLSTDTRIKIGGPASVTEHEMKVFAGLESGRYKEIAAKVNAFAYQWRA